MRALHQSLLSHYVWTSLLANQLALELVDCSEQEGAVPPFPPYFRWETFCNLGSSKNSTVVLEALKKKNLQPLTKKNPSMVGKEQKNPNYSELLLSKVCFRKLARE